MQNGVGVRPKMKISLKRLIKVEGVRDGFALKNEKSINLFCLLTLFLCSGRKVVDGKQGNIQGLVGLCGSSHLFWVCLKGSTGEMVLASLKSLYYQIHNWK